MTKKRSPSVMAISTAHFCFAFFVSDRPHKVMPGKKTLKNTNPATASGLGVGHSKLQLYYDIFWQMKSAPTNQALSRSFL